MVLQKHKIFVKCKTLNFIVTSTSSRIFGFYKNWQKFWDLSFQTIWNYTRTSLERVYILTFIQPTWPVRVMWSLNFVVMWEKPSTWPLLCRTILRVLSCRTLGAIAQKRNSKKFVFWRKFWNFEHADNTAFFFNKCNTNVVIIV